VACTERSRSVKLGKMGKKIYAFIDASNLFYGGEKSLGWKIDYQKLINYIKKQYKARKVFYYGGVETDGFPYSVLEKKAIDLDKLLAYLQQKSRSRNLTQTSRVLLQKHIQRVKFYRKLKQFGYLLRLKPVKIFKDEQGRTTKKANCDVDMTFDLMRYFQEYSGVLVLSGDGDFAVVLKYLKEKSKQVTILARGERTAREIRQLANENFRDFSRLETKLKFGER